MKTSLKTEDIRPYREEILQRIREKHIRTGRGHDGRLFLISTAYPGYWLEHLYDSVAWAKLYPEDTDIAVSQARLFLENQREDGRIPYCILDNDLMNSIPGLTKAYTGLESCPPGGLTVRYFQLQECVSAASLCLDIWRLDPSQDLKWFYDRLCRWDEWLCKNRMTRGMGLVETFCGFDTGHDRSGRFAGMKYPENPCKIEAEYSYGYPVDCDEAPLISPDINAVFYGSRMALAEMAELLGMEEEAAGWHEKAAQVKKRLMEVCFDPETRFFYDVDKHDRMIRVKSISITTLFCEHLLDRELADEIYDRYLAAPDQFGTPFPFPGTAVSDPAWVQNYSGNSWGFYSQGNVAMRTLRWMEYYGRREEMLAMMETWLRAWCRPGILKFGQELHPITGEPSACSEWYSTTMLYLLTAMKTLGI
ncbi:MAG: hypothetical protein IJD13_05385 [Oscillospiraceae bacterium]|nr:hypothetical protein [Oscillospiraceae bacterium]